MRCDMVDLYYALYGSKRPFCLGNPDSTGLPNVGRIPKLSAAAVKSRPESPFDYKPDEMVEHLRPETPKTATKRDADVLIDDEDLEVKVEPFEVVKVIFAPWLIPKADDSKRVILKIYRKKLKSKRKLRSNRPKVRKLSRNSARTIRFRCLE